MPLHPTAVLSGASIGFLGAAGARLAAQVALAALHSLAVVATVELLLVGHRPGQRDRPVSVTIEMVWAAVTVIATVLVDVHDYRHHQQGKDPYGN